MKTKKLKFNSDAIYNGEKLYTKGEVAEVSDENGFADRWIKRGLAEEHVDESEVKDSEPKSSNKHFRKPKHIEKKKEDEQTEIGSENL